MSTAKAPGLTWVLISCRCRFMAWTLASRRADRTEQIGPLVALIAWRGRSRAAFGPDPGQAALLANPRLVLPPQLGLAARGEAAAGRQSFFMRLLRFSIRLRVAWPHRDVAEAQRLQYPPDAALIHRHEETGQDPVTQIAQSPAHNTIFGNIGPWRTQLLLLFDRQLR